MKEQKEQKQEKVTVNEFGVPLYIDKKSPTALRERVKLLKLVAKTGKSVDKHKPLSEKALARVQMHLKWYSAELRKLTEGKGKKKAS